MIGYIILFLVVTALSMKFYYEQMDKTTEERYGTRYSRTYKWYIAIIYIVYAVLVVAGLAGSTLFSFLAILATIAGLAFLYLKGRTADKTRATAITFLAVPFGTAINCAVSKALGGSLIALLLGVVIGLLAIAAVYWIYLVCRNKALEGGE